MMYFIDTIIELTKLFLINVNFYCFNTLLYLSYFDLYNH